MMKKLIFVITFLFFATLIFAQPEKVVLIEEGTGTWCQWCPRGTVFTETISDNYDKVLFVAVHNSDPMANDDYDSASQFGSFPNGHIDRKLLNIDPEDWETSMQPQLNENPPAGINVTTTFDNNTREMTMNITADFVENLSGDYRLAAIVVEDGVIGPAPSYDQSNSYSGGASGPMGGYENLPSPVPASLMVYNHVGRYLPGGYDGDVGSLPSNINAGETHDYTYNYTLPDDYREDYVRVIGLLVSPTGEILNAGGSIFLTGWTNGHPFFHSQPQEQGFVGQTYQYEIITHDPEYDDLTISEISGLPSWLSLTDLGDGKGLLSGIPTEEADYNITLTTSDGNHTEEQNFVLSISVAAEDWIQLGDPGFTLEEADALFLEINSQGIPYICYGNFNGDVAVYKFENEIWEKVGSSLQGFAIDVFHMDFALSLDDIPYVFSEGQTIRHDGSSWSTVGSNFQSGLYGAITFGADGTLYATNWDPPTGSIAKHFDGTNWLDTGNGMLADDAVVWTKMKTGNNGFPIAIYGTDGQNIAYSEVAQFDGTAWSVVGGGYIEPTSQTYFDHDIAQGANGEIYAALTIGIGVQQLNIYQLVNDVWELHTENLTGGATENCSIEIDQEGGIIVAFRDENNSGKTSVMRYDGTNWVNLGLPGFTPLASAQTLALNSEGVPFVAYSDESESGKASVKKYEDLTISVFQPELSQQEIRLFPNPNEGIFNLEFEKGNHYQVINRVYTESLNRLPFKKRLIISERTSNS